MENLDKGLTVPKMGADKYPKCPKNYFPILSVQAKKNEISIKIRGSKSVF